MAKLVTEEQVIRCLWHCLKKENYSLSPLERPNGQTGVDIRATRAAEEVIYIETIGFDDRPPVRSSLFYQAFFRAVSRLNHEDLTHCVIALPKRYERGMHQRVKQHWVAWNRIANAFPELEVWFVNVDNGTYERQSWSKWASSSKPASMSS